MNWKLSKKDYENYEHIWKNNNLNTKLNSGNLEQVWIIWKKSLKSFGKKKSLDSLENEDWRLFILCKFCFL